MTSVPHEFSSIEVVRIVVSSRILNNWLKSNYSLSIKARHGSIRFDSTPTQTQSRLGPITNSSIWFDLTELNVIVLSQCVLIHRLRGQYRFCFGLFINPNGFLWEKKQSNSFFSLLVEHTYIYFWYHILYP